jgi:hypothetical protein
MWECFSDSGFIAEVVFRCLPSVILWLGFSYMLKLAADWF